MNIFRDNWKRYRGLGLIPYPASSQGKNPLTKWGDSTPTIDLFQDWERKYSNANIWVYIGPKFAVIDPDGLGAEEFVQSLNLPLCPTSISGNKSIHRWFKTPSPIRFLKIQNGDGTFLELRTGNMGMLVPPSIHPETGKPYKWADGLSPWDVPFPELPPEAYQKIVGLAKKSETKMEPAQPENPSLGSLDVKKYLDHHGIKYTVKPDGARTIYALERCLFADGHTTQDTKGDSSIIQGADGKLWYQCFHNHCGFRTWKDARMAISGRAPILEFFSTSRLPDESTPRFPKELIGGVASEFADLYTSYLEPPWSFFAFNFFACLGHLFCDRVTLQSEIEPEPRLYVVNVGESADDRKSASIQKTLRFFENAMEPGTFKTCWGVGSAEGLANRLKDNPRMLLVFDELKTFVSKAAIDGAILLPAVNTLFEDMRFHSATKQHSIELDGIHLSLLAASTYETFNRMWGPAFLDIGFLNRLWIVKDHGEKKFSIPREIPFNEIMGLKKKMGELLKRFSSPEKYRLPIDDESRELFDGWYFNVENSPLTKRLDGYGLRLMILFAINEGQDRITPEITDRVISLLRWQLEVRRETAPIDAEGNVAKMEISIRRALSRGQMVKRDLQRKVNYTREGLFCWNNAIKNLQAAREVFFDPKTGIYRQARL